MNADIPTTNWIWIPDWEKENPETAYLARFRKVFLVEQIPDSIKIFISADSRYKLYINGILAEIGPCKGDRFIWCYDEVELASYLRVGENVLAVEVLRYPLTGWGNHSIIRTPPPF